MKIATSTAAAILFAVAVLFLPAVWADAGQGARPVYDRRGVPQSPLADLRYKRHVYLVATSLPVGAIDARQAQDEASYARAVIAEVLDQDAGKMRRIPDAYQDMADQLKKYAER